MSYSIENDRRWTYHVSGYDEAANLLVNVMAGSPIGAEYVAQMFREKGLINVKCEDLASSGGERINTESHERHG